MVRGTLPAALGQLAARETVDAIRLSLLTTVSSTVLIVVLGVPFAFWLAHGRRFYHRLIEALCELPVALPPAAAGVALLIAFGRTGYLDLSVSFTAIAVVMAQIFVAAPFFLRAAVNAFEDQSPQMFQVALMDGATKWKMLTAIAMPIAGRALVGGATIAWARAAGEFGATIIFAGNYPGRTQTMPLAIYLSFQSNLDQALALSVLLLGVAVVAILIVGLLSRGDVPLE